MTAKNIKNFYRFDALNISNGSLNFKSSKINMTIKNGSDNLYINTVLFRLSYKIIQKNGHYLFSRIDLAKLIDPVLRPSYIKTAKRFDTVIIDPGHGGSDPGSVNRYGKEKDFNLRLAKILMKDLERKGFRVRMTRSSSPLTADSSFSLSQFVASIPRAFSSRSLVRFSGVSTPATLTLSFLKRSNPKSVVTSIVSPSRTLLISTTRKL